MPVGDSTNYTPANINVNAGSFSSASFGVKVSVGKHGSNTSTTDYLNRSWTVTNTGITGLSYDPTFTYVAGDVAGTEANLYGGAYNGSVWLAAAAVNTGTHSFTGTGFSAPSLDFTAGELSVLSVKQTLEQPKVFALLQNYPNPFNPTTTIQYGLPARSTVRLVVYNILGQVEKELINAEQQAGYQSAVWNANISSGMYFYRLEVVSAMDPSKRFVETKKMLLLR